MNSHDLAKRLLNLPNVKLVIQGAEDSRDNSVFVDVQDAHVSRMTDGGEPFVAVIISKGSETYGEVA